ncbi:SLC13 family permease [Nocardioides mesophilus]|uniref:Arsenic transporter n=1 Tax=Nocardioides mesophilus TaxID=433659 RepID=A0A7G9R7V2_9ACTN|nr:SLC13 family permease [Nocardioides mesophilus]QNN51677.1 arsenic transporter [Nocardioides mesophilus]
MPLAVLDAVAVLTLVALLAVAFAHPSQWWEGTAGVAAAALMLAIGAVDLPAAREQVLQLLPVVLFLCAILVVATLCAAEGVFRTLGALLSARAGGSPVRMLTWTFLTAAVTTAVLSLDATVVLLTPVAVLAATGSRLRSRPVAYACARLANSASLLLPVSNLTNLLAMPALGLTFHEFAVRMAPAWAAVLAVEYVGLRVFFRRELAEGRSTGSPATVERTEQEWAERDEVDEVVEPAPVVALAVVALMLVGFAVGSPLGVEPAWVAGAAAAVLAAHALRRRVVRPATVLRASHLPFALFVLGLGVVVAALVDGFLGDLVGGLLPAGDGLASLLLVALLATVLANLVNNLPATLLLVPLVAPLGGTALLVALVGLNVGSGLTYPGSLANLLWRRSMTTLGPAPRAAEFHRLAALVTPPAVLAGVVVLWALG